MLITDHHTLAVLTGSVVASSLTDLLPEGDIIDELKNLLTIQTEIIMHQIEGRHYGSNNLDNYINYADNVFAEIERINAAN